MREPRYSPLDRERCLELAAALGDTPETVISVYQLNAGLSRAYVAGSTSRFHAVVVQNSDLPAEPVGFGEDAKAIWEILRDVEGWKCVTVSLKCAPVLGRIIEEETGRAVRYYGDVYHVLKRPAPRIPHPAVRRLEPSDVALVKAAEPELRVTGMGSPEAMLTKGLAAGAIIDGRLVANAHTSARSTLHADIGVYTVESFRGRGLATAAAALVARLIQEAGQTPVWSCGEGNRPSLAIAKRLGFEEVSRRTYVIPAAAADPPNV